MRTPEEESYRLNAGGISHASLRTSAPIGYDICMGSLDFHSVGIIVVPLTCLSGVLVRPPGPALSFVSELPLVPSLNHDLGVPRFRGVQISLFASPDTASSSQSTERGRK